MNRDRMRRLTEGVKAAGGAIHVTARGGLCAHDHLGGPGNPMEPLPGADQEGADWLLALATELWPKGVPGCPNNEPGDLDA